MFVFNIRFLPSISFLCPISVCVRSNFIHVSPRIQTVGIQGRRSFLKIIAAKVHIDHIHSFPSVREGFHCFFSMITYDLVRVT